MSVLISVVVCTFNRAELLAVALQSLCRQTLAQSLYEIVVVDNNSTDNTPVVVKKFMSCGNMRYFLETDQGLSHARNRGWQEAKGEYVAYIDDDCKTPEQWLETAREVIAQSSPAILGGPFFASYNTPRPGWFRDSYGSYSLGEQARPLNRNEYLYGGNIFFRRSLLQAIGGFDPRLGMNGRKVAYGEETSLQKRVREVMPDEAIYYDPKLYLYHTVRPEKMTLLYNLRVWFADGRQVHLLDDNIAPVKQSPGQVLARAARTLAAFCLDLIRGAIKRDHRRYPHLQNYLCEHAFARAQEFGMLYEQFRQRVKKPQINKD